MTKHLPQLFLILMLCPVIVQAQDPYFSQFYANRVYLNPAYAGFDPGTTLTLNYRDQWFGVPDGAISTFGESFRTYNASLELQTPCFFNDLYLGLAGFILRDEAGEAPLATTVVGLAVSPVIKLGRDASLHTGFMFTYNQRRFKGGYFIYSDQIDAVDGLGSNIPTELDFSTNFTPDLNVGVMFRQKISDRSFFVGGLGLSNVLNHEYLLLDNAGGYRVPTRATVHFGGYFKLSNRYNSTFLLAPNLRYERQGPLDLITVGAFGVDQNYYTGLFLQFNSNPPILSNTTTVILTAGIDIYETFNWDNYSDQNLYLGLSYDFNVAGLRSNRTLGTLEINLRFNFGRGRSNMDCKNDWLNRFNNRGIPCPVL